ncbi:hypothetical protein AGDE_11315 [Angomonas deanei]|nr:hypothetical protein AGDE_11315 [Angomonas deanei]|eukprot:EPY26447.1 hypothetical protein AGDE_11315 [Angomonas deanei]
MSRQQANLRGGKDYSTELAGRDRFKFFKRPVEGEEGAIPVPMGQAQIHYAASCPTTPPLPEDTAHATSYSRHLMGGSAGRGRPHHLPRLNNNNNNNNANTTRTRKRSKSAGRKGTKESNNNNNNFAATYSGMEAEEGVALGPNQRTTGVQTVFRENEAQTDPYSPDYFIPEGAPEPEILKLQHLTFKNGLPPGKEEVELIQRLRRRREVEASVPQGDDAASIEARYRILHELEEIEWKEREEHVEQLQERRLQQIQQSLLEREEAREAYNRERLEAVKASQTGQLRTKLEKLETKRMGTTRQALDRKLNSTYDPSKPLQSVSAPTSGRVTGKKNKDLLQSYVHYGKEAQAPQLNEEVPVDGRQTRAAGAQYDIRPALLATPHGVEEVEAAQGTRIERVKESAFVVPENAVLNQQKTLYKRHEAEKLVNALEYAHQTIQEGKSGETLHSNKAETKRVLDLYRATPKVERPDTPELELDGDSDEDVEEGCILLQRLLRGRAVQNDFFEGKERCRGLIEELQAASNAKFASRTLTDAREREALAAQREAMLCTVMDEVQGDIIAATLGYLTIELDRQRELLQLRTLREEMQNVRRQREEEERQRRETVRRARDREEVQYAALVSSTAVTTLSFLQDVLHTAVAETALAVAVDHERERQSLLPPPRNPTNDTEKENVVCDMMDQFIIGAVVDRNLKREAALDKRAPALASFMVALEGMPQEPG